MDEYLDLVDENDVVIGRKLRSEVYAEGLSNFRVINAFVKNSEGKLWIPLRGPNKRIYPNALDMSVGGHVESGEDYDFSFARETSEELNIDTTKTPWRLLGKLTPHEHGVSAFMQVYEISADAVPHFNPNDFTEAFWLTPKELRARLNAGGSAKSDLIKLLDIFFPEKEFPTSQE
jgi:isopentenyldiphosphate isomerase